MTGPRMALYGAIAKQQITVSYRQPRSSGTASSVDRLTPSVEMPGKLKTQKPNWKTRFFIGLPKRMLGWTASVASASEVLRHCAGIAFTHMRRAAGIALSPGLNGDLEMCPMADE